MLNIKNKNKLPTSYMYKIKELSSLCRFSSVYLMIKLEYTFIIIIIYKFYFHKITQLKNIIISLFVLRFTSPNNNNITIFR